MTKLTDNFLRDELPQHNFLQLNELDQFLRSKGAVSVVELHGLLTAVISAPEMVEPNKWMQLSKIRRCSKNHIFRYQKV